MPYVFVLFQGCFFKGGNNHRTQLSHVFLYPTPLEKAKARMFGQRFRSKTNKAQLFSIGPDSGSNLNTWFSGYRVESMIEQIMC